MQILKKFATCIAIICMLEVTNADFKEKTNPLQRQQCSFLKSLTDRQCKEPELENGVSVALEKEHCYSRFKLRKVKMKGCIPRKVISKDCVGKCNSVWFPGPKKGELGCFGCFPAEHVQLPVTFDCPGRQPKKLTKTVQVAKNCKCQSFKCSALAQAADI